MIIWRSIIYFPYPVRPQQQLVHFSHKFEFSYHQFVVKKILHDAMGFKLLVFILIQLSFTSFIYPVEIMYAPCHFNENTMSYTCHIISIRDILRFVINTMLLIGDGTYTPHSTIGRLCALYIGCAVKTVLALSIAIMLRQLEFSTMEARINAFLCRMNLASQKDLSAVIAMQATFRFSKSYKESLVWHQMNEYGKLYYRPLSAVGCFSIDLDLFSSLFLSFSSVYLMKPKRNSIFLNFNRI